MTMIKCPECRHHISSMAQACPECGCPIDPEWAEAEARKEMAKSEDVPFTIETGVEDDSPSDLPDREGTVTSSNEDMQSSNHYTPLPDREGTGESPESPEVAPKSKPAAPVPPAPKRSGAGWVVVLAVLLGLLIGGLYYYDYRSNQQREKRAYEMLQGSSNPASYEDFMIRYPKSEYIEDVKARYAVVAAQQNEWQRLVTNGTRDELQAFIRQHPTSPYKKIALNRIDSLDWASAKESHELEAVTHYMATHPDGYYIDQAETLRQQLEREKAQEEARRAAARRDSIARADSINNSHSITINLPF